MLSGVEHRGVESHEGANTFTIRDSDISRRNLVVEFREGRWVDLNLQSSDGTMLQDERIPPRAP